MIRILHESKDQFLEKLILSAKRICTYIVEYFQIPMHTKASNGHTYLATNLLQFAVFASCSFRWLDADYLNCSYSYK